MSIFDHIAKFRTNLIDESGERERPISKIVVTEKVWQKLTKQLGDDLFVPADAKSFTLIGIEVIREQKEDEKEDKWYSKIPQRGITEGS